MSEANDEMTTLLGGDEIEVTHLPADAFDAEALKRLEKFQPLLGTSERVKVRQVSVSRMQRYGRAILDNDEATALEIYTGRDPGWADTLTHESVNALADKGLEINLPFFGAWYQRQAKARGQQTPIEMQALQRKLATLEETIRTASLSRDSASTSPAPTG